MKPSFKRPTDGLYILLTGKILILLILLNGMVISTLDSFLIAKASSFKISCGTSSEILVTENCAFILFSSIAKTSLFSKNRFNISKDFNYE